MCSVIEAANITKEYRVGKNAVRVIRGINIQIDSGEFVSVVGPSGSGKSTLLYLLSGMEPVTEGDVWLFGQKIKDMTVQEEALLRRKKIGFVFQFYNLVEEMNVEDNILLPGFLNAEKPDQKKLEEILKMTGLEGQRKQFPNELSGGQQQRTAIARVIYQNPKIVFADEPTGNLDSVNGREIMKILLEINQRYRTTVILVTHNEEHAKYGTRIISLKDGQIESDFDRGK